MNRVSDTISSSWPERIAAAARSDPRKTTALGVLLLVLVIIVARALLTGHTLPSRASGSSTKPAASGAVTEAIGSSGFSGRDNHAADVDVSDSESRHSSRTHNAALRVREWLNEPIKPLPRNLFAVKLDYFPLDGSREPQGPKTAGDGEFWGRLEKSLMLQADQRDKRENLLANFRAEAGNLRLDSIIMGPQPKAMIDGKLVAEGDVVALFRVLRIEPRRIIVEREGIRLEILMK